ncbi:MAG: SDR family oxidoreductase [Endomicrobia bacterium]|nr:SDR family oxidoreductase [Endomicrobiia bacterium]MCX7940504.1 SDR family oxidoreductase [Endomicrobiia bacterium]MDW8055131.1 SDR family oxidoreductase [Elusimicrobiota bacterium]
MKILITGGAGFIGSHIVDACIKRGWDVIVVDNLATGKIENLNPAAKFYNVDITNFNKLEEIFKKEKPSIVNHHAAQIDVRKSVANPQYDADVNIVGSLNLLELCVKYKVDKFIFASSGGTIYGECNGKKPPKENSTPAPESPYGCAKLAAEYYIQYYSKVYGLKTVSLRYSNVYGPRQDPFGEAGVVAIFTNRMLKNEDVYIYGDGEQQRDFVHVEDVVRANLICMTENVKSFVYNIGTQKAVSVNTLFKILSKITNYKKLPIYKPPRKGELYKSFLNISKAKKELHWEPTVSLEHGLRNVVEYFSKNGK